MSYMLDTILSLLDCAVCTVYKNIFINSILIAIVHYHLCVHRSVELLHFFHVFSLSVANLLSCFVMVYVRPVTVLGSTFVRIFFEEQTKFFASKGMQKCKMDHEGSEKLQVFFCSLLPLEACS